MNPNIALSIICVLAVVLIVNQVFYLKRKTDDGRGHRFFSSGGLFFLAVFCGFCFLGTTELEKAAEMKWKTGYAIIGAMSLLGAFCMAWKKQ